MGVERKRCGCRDARRESEAGKTHVFALFSYEGSVSGAMCVFSRSVDLIRFAVLHSRSTQISQISPTQLADVWPVWEAE